MCSFNNSYACNLYEDLEKKYYDFEDWDHSFHLLIFIVQEYSP